VEVENLIKNLTNEFRTLKQFLHVSGTDKMNCLKIEITLFVPFRRMFTGISMENLQGVPLGLF